jgi:ATP-dependent Clp protease protease subunit
MTVPYVIEGQGHNERVYDLYSRLLRDRIIFIREEFSDELASSVIAQLLFLEAQDPDKDITMYIYSPGGYVSAAFGIYDTMNYIKSDVSTVCVGSAASGAAFIVSAGAKGKRYALKNARIMIHQVSGGADGHIEDMSIRFKETQAVNELWIQELSKCTGKKVAQIRKDMNRDYYMSAEEAKTYGIVDAVLDKRELR